MHKYTHHVTFHCFAVDIGHIIILLIFVVLVHNVLVLVILVLASLHHWLFVHWLLLQLLLLLLVGFAVIGDGNCVHHLWSLDIDPATGFDHDQPRFAQWRPARVFILVVLLRLVASRVLGVPLCECISQ